MPYLARVRFLWYTKPYTATLGTDRRWECDTFPTLADILNALYPLDDASPADGVLGHKQANDVARRFGGKAEFPEHPEPPEGVVY